VTEVHRFSLILFLSTLGHMVLIFGLHWTVDDPAPPTQTIDVTLARHADAQAPEDADFLAQANQQGSGTLAEKAELSTLEQAQFQANEIREVKASQRQEQQQLEQSSGNELISSKNEQWQEQNKRQEQQIQQEKSLSNDDERDSASDEIATLEAELRNERQAYAKRPRRRQLTAVSTRASVDAKYLNEWRQQVESVGNMNYPNHDLYGELTLLVAIRANGSIERMEVRRSSGLTALDDSAIRIVRQAAPFDPFPEEIRSQTDILEIIRTWRFERGGYLSSK